MYILTCWPPEYVFGVIGGGIVAAAAAVVIAVTVLIVCKLHKRKRQLQRITEVIKLINNNYGKSPTMLLSEIIHNIAGNF